MTNISKAIMGVGAILVAAALVVVVAAKGGHVPASNLVSNPAVNGSVASLSLTAPISGTLDAGETQKVNWTSLNYGEPNVAVALIRKVSDNPATYQLVRVIAPAKTNTGNATWVPAPTDVGTGLSIEVGCALSRQACTASSPTSQLAVVNDGRFANTATAYQAIEALGNK